MPLTSLLLAFAGGIALGAAVGWAARAGRARAEAAREVALRREAEAALRAEAEQARTRVAENEAELTEMAVAYQDLREHHLGVARQLDAARLHVRGLEDDLAVQQQAARVAREELGAARRRVGELEAQIRGRAVDPRASGGPRR
jgi:chromosome segregation ATPase